MAGKKTTSQQELRDAGLPVGRRARSTSSRSRRQSAGRFLRDKVWFFGSAKYSEVNVHPAGAPSFATGGLGYTTNDLHNLSGRVTWQVTPRSKVTGYIDRWFKSHDIRSRSPPANAVRPGVDWETATLHLPLNNRVPQLCEMDVAGHQPAAGGNRIFGGPIPDRVRHSPSGHRARPSGRRNGTPARSSRTSRLNTFIGQAQFQLTVRRAAVLFGPSSVSYVTGSHNAKVGVYYRYANSDSSAPGANAHLTQQYQSRSACQSARLRGPPPGEHQHRRVLRLRDGFVGPHRLTVTGGVRLDRFGGLINPTSLPAGRFVANAVSPSCIPSIRSSM